MGSVVSSWRERPTPEEIGLVVSTARRLGLLDERATVFHSLELMERRTDELHEAFPANALHAVAIKANPVLSVLTLLVARGAGLEAASLEEVALARAAGCPPDKIVYDSPAKTVGEISEAMRVGVHVNADSIAELDRIVAVRPEWSTSTVGLRVNPQVGDGAIPETSVAAAGSRFGEPVESVLGPLVQRARSSPWVSGLHYHVGSQGADAQIHAAAARVVSSLRDRLNRALSRRQFDVVDIGGGVNADYSGEVVAPPSEMAAMVRDAAPAFFEPDTRLVTEYGRAIQASCGWVATTVEYTKTVQGRHLVVVHVGADLLLRPAYRPEHWRHRFSHLSKGAARLSSHDGGDRSTICGPLCFAGDVIGRDIALPPVEAGDTLIIHDIGAYTVSMWSRHCSRGMPPIIGYRRSGSDVELSVLRRGETPDDVVRFWSADLASVSPEGAVGAGQEPTQQGA